MNNLGKKLGILATATVVAAGAGELMASQNEASAADPQASTMQGYKDFHDFAARTGVPADTGTHIILNRTSAVAFGMAAASDPNDPSKGIISYQVVHDSKSAIYDFRETVQINPDGSFSSDIAGGGRPMSGYRERDQYEEYVASETASQPDISENASITHYARESGMGVAGTQSPAGDYFVQMDQDQRTASLGTFVPTSDSAGVSIENIYQDADSMYTFQMCMFRENAESIEKTCVDYSRDFDSNRERDWYERTTANEKPGVTHYSP